MKDKVRVGAGNAPKGNQGLLRDFALGYPGAHEDFPWGERVVKVKGKVFVFLGREDPLGISVKLPQSRLMALALPFASPTGYGLGKSGWVTAQFGPREKPPIDVLKAWIDESYRAVAPKKLVVSRGSDAGTAVATKPEARAASTARPGASARKKK